ncbi:calcium-binding protein [Lyngbya aestuarii]|uniref:calcium-binding protein n=1 Tax=Lyngbya aestuarii TaxID=118322 RepID=UPI00403D5CA9
MAFILGTAGNDDLIGTQGSDIILGGEGNDTITGGAGPDMITGGSGWDLFVFTNVTTHGRYENGNYWVISDDGFDIITDFNDINEDFIQSYNTVTKQYQSVAGAIIIGDPPDGITDLSIAPNDDKILVDDLISTKIQLHPQLNFVSFDQSVL